MCIENDLGCGSTLPRIRHTLVQYSDNVLEEKNQLIHIVAEAREKFDVTLIVDV